MLIRPLAYYALVQLVIDVLKEEYVTKPFSPSFLNKVLVKY